MKKDEQIVNFISILKRLHKQHDKNIKKGHLQYSSAANTPTGKKAKAEQIIDASGQPEQTNCLRKSPVPIALISSRIHQLKKEGSCMYSKGTQSELTRDNLEVSRNYKQPPSYKKRTHGEWKSRKVQKAEEDNLIINQSNTQNGQQMIFSPLKVNFEAHSLSCFLWISPPKTKGNELNSFSAGPGKLLKKAPFTFMNYEEGRGKKINKYNKYCQQIYEKYSSRPKTYEQLGVNIGDSNKFNHNASFLRKGFNRRARFRTQFKPEREQKQYKTIKNIDLKEIGDRVQRDYLTKDKQEEIGCSQQEENQLLPKLQGLTPKQKISSAGPFFLNQGHSLTAEPAISSKPVLSQTKRSPDFKYKSKKKGQNKGEKFDTQRIWENDQEAEIKIDGWQMNCNKICNYGKVKNIISRSASIQGHDFI